MAIPVFLSRATPRPGPQANFVKAVCAYLQGRGLSPRTVGDTDFGMYGLEAVRGLVRQSNGLVSIAFQRTELHKREYVPASRGQNIGAQGESVEARWLTTPWCHMETAMAFQIGLPILLLVQEGVHQDGALEKGVLGQYPPTFALSENADHAIDLESAFANNAEKWRQLVGTWEGQVREVVTRRARPEALYSSPY